MGVYEQRLKLPNIIDDPYVAGIVLGKLGLAEVALRTRAALLHSEQRDAWLWRPGELRRLFLDGMAEAEDFTFLDVAAELQWMRAGHGVSFDAMLSRLPAEDQREIRLALRARVRPFEPGHIPTALERMAHWR